MTFWKNVVTLPSVCISCAIESALLYLRVTKETWKRYNVPDEGLLFCAYDYLIPFLPTVLFHTACLIASQILVKSEIWRNQKLLLQVLVGVTCHVYTWIAWMYTHKREHTRVRIHTHTHNQFRNTFIPFQSTKTCRWDLLPLNFIFSFQSVLSLGLDRSSCAHYWTLAPRWYTPVPFCKRVFYL